MTGATVAVTGITVAAIGISESATRIAWMVSVTIFSATIFVAVASVSAG